jgi:hypothetical protein
VSISHLDFVPLVKSIRTWEFEYGSKKKKPLRSSVALELKSAHGWPIGDADYRTFKTYSRAAMDAGFVLLGDCEAGPFIRSTGRLERLCDSKPHTSPTTCMVDRSALHDQSAEETIGRKAGRKPIAPASDYFTGERDVSMGDKWICDLCESV